ncbi:hypothetical protein Tco_0150409 [Tanacetum coccineum]
MPGVSSFSRLVPYLSHIVGAGKDQCASSNMENVQKKNDDDFVAAEYLNEYNRFSIDVANGKVNVGSD